MARKNNRKPEQTRPITFTRAYTDQTAGSVLAECGRTRVLCTVSVQDQVPQWMYGKQQGAWLTAEYSMLPGASSPRKPRDGRTSRPIDGRSFEIQRLIGRALRCAVDLSVMPEVTLWIDCDVLSADGGTRTTSVNGAVVALYDALLWMEEQKQLRNWPLRGLVSAISVGLCDGVPMVDLDYHEDSAAEVDLTVVAASEGKLIEVAGSAERRPFTGEQLTTMIGLAQTSCAEIRELQKKVLGI
ncbi:MAG: ribonuclease PH [Planctomycetes bacterium]|nr:ribonuclease PH [Planctomycetota bacterium]